MNVIVAIVVYTHEMAFLGAFNKHIGLIGFINCFKKMQNKC